MKAIKLPIQNLNSDDKDKMLSLLSSYNNVFRYSFNRFQKDEMNQKQIRHDLKNKNISTKDSWFDQCAILDSSSVFERFKSEKVTFGGKSNYQRFLKKTNLKR